MLQCCPREFDRMRNVKPRLSGISRNMSLRPRGRWKKLQVSCSAALLIVDKQREKSKATGKALSAGDLKQYREL
jgi:hypothetical protein